VYFSPNRYGPWTKYTAWGTSLAVVKISGRIWVRTTWISQKQCITPLYLFLILQVIPHGRNLHRSFISSMGHMRSLTETFSYTNVRADNAEWSIKQLHLQSLRCNHVLYWLPSAQLPFSKVRETHVQTEAKLCVLFVFEVARPCAYLATGVIDEGSYRQNVSQVLQMRKQRFLMMFLT
jgi:hypothetical protein